MRYVIEDVNDPRLDDVRNLKKSDAHGEGLVIGEGPIIVERLLASAYPTRCIVGFKAKIDTYLSQHEVPDDVPIYEVTRDMLTEVAEIGIASCRERV